MSVKEKIRDIAVKAGEKAADRGPQCNQITSSITWKNRKYTFVVCAKSKAKAARKITAAQLNAKVKTDAEQAVLIDCTGGESCGDTQECLPGDLVYNAARTHGPVCRPTGPGTCTPPETEWTCDVWADVTASKQCGCKLP